MLGSVCLARKVHYYFDPRIFGKSSADHSTLYYWWSYCLWWRCYPPTYCRIRGASEVKVSSFCDPWFAPTLYALSGSHYSN